MNYANDDRPQREMHSGNWTCCDCGTGITSLPFNPKTADNLRCMDCLKKQRGDKPRERRTFEGNWKCHMCDALITQLPFNPRDESTLKCVDCLKKSRPANDDAPAAANEDIPLVA